MNELQASFLIFMVALAIFMPDWHWWEHKTVKANDRFPWEKVK